MKGRRREWSAKQLARCCKRYLSDNCFIYCVTTTYHWLPDLEPARSNTQRLFNITSRALRTVPTPRNPAHHEHQPPWLFQGKELPDRALWIGGDCGVGDGCEP